MSQYGYWMGILILLVCLKSAHYFDSDEGLILEGAWGLLHGRELYTDSFQFVAPGSFYAVSWIWHLLSPDYAWAKMLGGAAVLLTAVAIFRISILVGRNGVLNYVPPLVYSLASAIWPTINHNTFNVAFLAWAAFFCVRAVATGSLLDLAVGGVLTGLATLFLQHKGMAFFLAVLLFLLFLSVRERKPWVVKGAGLYVVFFLAPLVVLVKWPASVLLEDLVRFPLLHYREVNRVSFVPLLVAAFYTVLIFYMLRDRLTKGVLMLFAVQVILLATSLQRTDWSHVLILLFPVLSMAPAAYGKARAIQLSKLTRYTYNGAAIAAMVFVLTVAGVSLIVRPPFYDETRDVASALLTYVDKNCGSLYAGPFMPGMYYEARRLNPTPYPVLLTGLNTASQFARARAELQAVPPECAVVNYAMVRRFNYDRNNPVDDFIRMNYEPFYAYQNVLVYRLRVGISSSNVSSVRR